MFLPLSHLALVNSHKKTYHDGAKKHVCNYCGHACFTGSHLKRHIMRKHEERTKDHQCDLCDKAFYELLQLNQHKKRVHEATHSEICKICGKTFKESHHLMNHIKGVHEGISWKEILKKRSNKNISSNLM